MLRNMQSAPFAVGSCPVCSSSGTAEYILLQVRPGSGLWAVDDASRVGVAVSCGACHSLQWLLHSYPLNPLQGVVDQLRLLEGLLYHQTGLPVFHEPPDDPPAGVREPRRPLPGAGLLGEGLMQPG